MIGSFDLKFVKIILGSFGAHFSELGHYNLKMAHHRVQKMDEIWALWVGI